MSAPSQNSRRQTQDVLKLMKSYKVDVNEKKRELVVRFHGPPNTLYHGGVWKVLVHIPVEYPHKPPGINFVTKIFHPNIDIGSGDVCLDVLNEKWSPVFNLTLIFEMFLPQLLTYPNPDDPYNVIAAIMYRHRSPLFNTLVKKYITCHGTDKTPEAGSGGDSFDPSSSS